MSARVANEDLSRSGRPLLITGARGQVGSELVRLAEDHGIPVVGLDRNDLDISDEAAVDATIRTAGAAVVINCAAYTDVDQAESDSETARAVNGLGPGYLAAACSAGSIPLVHVSTDYVFDGLADRAYLERDAPNPINVYGRTKLEGELRVQRTLERHLIIRTSSVFAPGHGNFVTTLTRLMRERGELRVVQDQITSPTPATALAASLLALARRAAEADEINWGIVHIAGEPPVSRFAWAEAILERLRSRERIACRRVVPVTSAEFRTPARRPPLSALDTSYARRVFELPSTDWRSYLDATIFSAVKS